MAERSDELPFDSPDIPYTVPDSSPGVSAYKRVDEAGGARVDITYVIPWDRRFDARIALLGNHVRVAGQPGAILRTPAHQLDWDDDDRYTYCISATQTNQAPIKGKVGDTNADYAIFQCVYQSQHYRPQSDEDVVGEPYPEMIRYISFPAPKRKTVTKSAKGGTWVWDSDGKDAIEATFINASEMHWPVKLWMWPRASVPWDVIDELQDSSNDAEITIGEHVWGEGVLIFNGDVGLEEIELPDGEPGVNLTYWFVKKRYGANAFPRADMGGRYEGVSAKDGSGNVPYPPDDFRRLFEPI